MGYNNNNNILFENIYYKIILKNNHDKGQFTMCTLSYVVSYIFDIFQIASDLARHERFNEVSYIKTIYRKR